VLDVNRQRAVDGGGVTLVGWGTIKGGQGTHFIKYQTTTMMIIVIIIVPCLRRLCPFMGAGCHLWALVVVYEQS
jgi:hypothetical protein